MAKKLGRPRAKHPKTQRHFSVAYAHLLEPLKAKIAPPGLELSDGQAVDICIATLHELLVEKRGEIVDPEKMMALINRQFRSQFVEAMVKVLTELGHTDVHTEWRKDFSVKVTCDAGGFTVPPEMFARADADSMMRELRTGLSV